MKPDSAILTIAIPTYNRAAKLAAQLERLLPQLTPEVRLCVYDNASPDHTREVVAQFPGVAYFRAATNCGASRNFFCCFEGCATEWLWLLGDDDLVTPTVVPDLLAVLRHETADFVHMNFCEQPYARDEVVTDLPALFQHSNFSALLWNTSGMYRIRSFRPLFRLYNESMSTWAAHMVMVLGLLESQKGKVHLSPLKLTVPAPTRIHWSTVEGLLRFSRVPDCLQRPASQRLVAASIYPGLFNKLMLWGLRETSTADQIRRWQRMGSQARFHLQAHRASGVVSHVFRNWHRAGQRRATWQLAQQAIQIRLLSWCPVALFHVLARCLPLEKSVRENHYNQRKQYATYG